MEPNKSPHEQVEIDRNHLRPSQERAAIAPRENDGMEAENLLIEVRPFLQVLASIITRLYGERREEPPLHEPDSAVQSKE